MFGVVFALDPSYDERIRAFPRRTDGGGIESGMMSESLGIVSETISESLSSGMISTDGDGSLVGIGSFRDFSGGDGERYVSRDNDRDFSGARDGDTSFSGDPSRERLSSRERDRSRDRSRVRTVMSIRLTQDRY